MAGIFPFTSLKPLSIKCIRKNKTIVAPIKTAKKIGLDFILNFSFELITVIVKAPIKGPQQPMRKQANPKSFGIDNITGKNQKVKVIIKVRRIKLSIGLRLNSSFK